MTNSSNLPSSKIKVIKSVVITEKSTLQLQNNRFKKKQYTFVVDRYSKKPIIKAEIEYFFKVKVVKINTCLLPRKKKRVGKCLGYKPQYKKAIVTLAEDNTINLFEESE